MSLDGLRAEVRDVLLRDPDDRVDRADVEQELVRRAPLLAGAALQELVDGVWSDVHGLGFLDPLLADDDVTDVMVVGGRGVWIERSGILVDVGGPPDQREVERLVERIVSPLGLRADRAAPVVDARLPDGSRVNVVLPPLAVDGPCLTIRRFRARQLGLEDLCAPPVAELLRRSVIEGRNLLVSGATGTGKTTLLNALASAIGKGERVVTVEDAAELRLPLDHVVRLEARPANSDGIGRAEIRSLVRNALRMRPDRLIVGEVRGGEAADMLQAMSTGHDGSMSTCHAGDPLEALDRVASMVLLGPDPLPPAVVERQLARAIDVVVQMERGPGSSRVVACVAEVRPSTDLGVDVVADRSRIVGSWRRPARRMS